MKSVVVLSGGLDSTYNFFQACAAGEVVLALTFDYGQRAAAQEIQAARAICEFKKVRHLVVELPFFKEFTCTSLVNRNAEVPSGVTVQIDSQSQSEKTATSVWVPNRNGIFLNVAAGFAEGLGATHVICGFNLEEAQTFPDNSAAFLKSVDQSFSFSTANQIKTHCYSIEMNKTQIVAELLKIDFPIEKIWSCYQNQSKPCGECESCQRLKRALQQNNIQWAEVYS